MTPSDNPLAEGDGASPVGHTKGPWGYEASSVVSKASLPANRTHGYGCGNDFVACLNDGEYHEYSSREEQDANGRLIAAAPALKQLVAELVAELAYARGDAAPTWVDYLVTGDVTDGPPEEQARQLLARIDLSATVSK